MRRGAGTLLLWCVPTLALGQSLADVARKEKERRQKNEETGVKPRVVTEEELEAGKGELANDPDAAGMYDPTEEDDPAPAATGARRTGSGGAAEGGNKNEEQWRARYAAAAARVEAAEKHYNDLMAKPGWEQPMPRPDRTGKLVTPLPTADEDVTLAKANLEKPRAALESLRDLARRQNIPPGWLR